MIIERSSFFAHHLKIKHEEAEYIATLEVDEAKRMIVKILDKYEHQVDIPLEILLQFSNTLKKAAHDVGNFFLAFDPVLDENGKEITL